MSKNQISLKDNPENKRIIEEWMRRHNSGRFFIKPNNLGINSQSKMQNGIQSYPIIVSVTKKDHKNENFGKSNLSPNKRINTNCNSIQSNVIKRKIARWSSPAISIKIESVGSKSEKKESHSESSTASKQDSQPLQLSKYLKDKLPAPANLKKICVPTKKGTKTGKSHVIYPKSTAILQIKDEQDVYSSIKDNYKHLLTPKYWSVTQFENDLLKQCIVFSKPHVINENEKLITVMQRSLIIDKGGTMHYSVYGLPVNIKGTILPNALDSIKKLLSILHIFDKMQVCKGLGDDILIVKTDSLVQDVCQVWRHTDCKLVLVKADQCQFCLDTRNALLEKEMLFKSEILSLQCVETQIKEEQI